MIRGSIFKGKTLPYFRWQHLILCILNLSQPSNYKFYSYVLFRLWPFLVYLFIYLCVLCTLFLYQSGTSLFFVDLCVQQQLPFSYVFSYIYVISREVSVCRCFPFSFADSIGVYFFVCFVGFWFTLKFFASP